MITPHTAGHWPRLSQITKYPDTLSLIMTDGIKKNTRPDPAPAYPAILSAVAVATVEALANITLHANIMKKHILTCFVASALLVAFTGCATHCHSAAWEYKVIRRPAYAGEMETQLNDLAKQGWNVVSVSLSEEGVPSEHLMQTATIVLKRVKE